MTVSSNTALALLNKQGFDYLHDNTLGACYESCTAFIQLEPDASSVLGWLWDVDKNMYVKDSRCQSFYNSQAELIYSVEQVLQHLENLAEQDFLSAGLERVAQEDFRLLKAQ